MSNNEPLDLDEMTSGGYNEIPPSGKLYHYTDSDGLVGILSSRTFRATDVRYMNDSTELDYGRRLVLDQIAEREKRADLDEAIQRCFTAIRKEAAKPSTITYATCFCENADELPQWRGYGKSTGGYCLEFDVSRFHSGFGCSREVIYDDQRQREKASELIDHLVGEYRKALADPRVRHDALEMWDWLTQSALGALVATFKDGCFASESEWRLVLSHSDNAFDVLGYPNYRAGIIGLTPFTLLEFDDSEPCLYPTSYPYEPPVARTMKAERIGGVRLSKVICGPTHHADLAVDAVRNLLAKSEFEGVEVVNSQVPIRW